MGKWLARLGDEFLERHRGSTDKTDNTRFHGIGEGVLSVLAVPTPSHSEKIAQTPSELNPAEQLQEHSRRNALRLRAAALGGVFYDEDDMTLLLRLIHAGDDLAGLETLIADAEAQVVKAGARIP